MINSINNFNYEDVKKEINEENNLNNALDKDLEAVDEESYKSLPVLYPAYNTYNEKRNQLLRGKISGFHPIAPSRRTLNSPGAKSKR